MSETPRRGAGLTDYQVDQVIGRLLQFGVLIAAAVVLVSGAMLLVAHGSAAVNLGTFRSEPAALRGVFVVVRAALHGETDAIVQLGLVLLILTPVARVALTLGAFTIQRDRTYMVLTAIVLVLLLYGLVWGRA
jgi:uncharacterized membrane protein